MGAVPLRSKLYATALVVATTALLLVAADREHVDWAGFSHLSRSHQWDLVGTGVILFGMILLAEFFDITFPGALAFAVSVGAALALAAGLQLGPFFGPIVVLVAHLVEGLYSRRQPFKTVVNVANYALSTFASAVLYHSLVDNDLTPLKTIANTSALVLAAITFIMVNTWTLSLIVAPVVGTTPLTMWRANFDGLFVELITLPALGGLVPVLAMQSKWALLVLIIPLIGPHFAFKAVRKAQEETRVVMEGLADTLERRDPYTHQHSMRVTEYVEAILHEMPHVSYEAGKATVTAARIHDLGKVGIPDLALSKPGPLDAAERHAMQEHPQIGAEIVGRLEMYRSSSAIVRHHHERWDGAGYPDGLHGEEIPLGARIIAVADAFDAMTSDRAYRRAMSDTQALAELRRNSGIQFDPQVVAAFERVLAEPAAVAEPRFATAAAK